MSKQIVVNGEPRETVSANLTELLDELRLADRKIAVELNRQIVRRTDYTATNLSAGDRVEIIHFVGGG